MDEQPRDSATLRRIAWRRWIVWLIVALLLAAWVSRRDLHLSWPATALVLAGYAAGAALWARFATHKLVPWLARRPRTWQSRAGHFKVTVRCNACGNSTEMTGGQSGSCPSCGQAMPLS